MYRCDSAWQDARARYLDESGNEDDRLMRSTLAAFEMFLIERAAGGERSA